MKATNQIMYDWQNNYLKKMRLAIREEKYSDQKAVFDLIEQAFRSMEKSDHREQLLVERLRKSQAFIPQLSLIAEFNSKVIGHILLTKITIVDGDKSFESLALAPLAVLPKFQNKSIGGRLILSAHQKAKELGYKSIVVIGHPDYYPKFGYQPAKKFNIELPFDVDEEKCLAVELVENGLKGVSGKVEYPQEFYE